MKVLSLFSGTGSFEEIFEELGWEYYSVDKFLHSNKENCSKHYLEDILTWDYKKEFNIGDFDLITASPPCCFFSTQRNSWIGRKLKKHGDTIITKEILQQDLEQDGLPLLHKAREIIDYFKPKHYLIENPQSGKMKKYITDLPYHDCDYCMYSDWGYRKRTRIWTNIPCLSLKLCNKNCGNMATADSHKIKVSGVHSNTTNKGHKVKVMPGGGSDRLDRFRIPYKLIRDIMINIV
tara:strand:+ start:1297 stop:2001 length:705 start_codon:yes stop_codon:yes gene_type:complete